MSANKEILDIQKEMFSRKGSSLAKYQDLVVGRRGLGALLAYEFAQTFVCGMPGALGLILRRWMYPLLLGRCGRNVTFGAHVTLRHPHKIFIGDDVVIDDHCLLDAKGESNHGIEIGSGVFIGRNTILHCKNGDIRIGDAANIGFNCDIASSNRVEIGERTLMAAYSYVVGGGHDHSRGDVPIMDQQRVAHGISIGRNGWIGAGVTVLDGVTIGEGVIVGTGAVVNDSLPDRAVAVGIPAKVLRLRESSDVLTD